MGESWGGDKCDELFITSRKIAYRSSELPAAPCHAIIRADWRTLFCHIFTVAYMWSFRYRNARSRYYVAGVYRGSALERATCIRCGTVHMMGATYFRFPGSAYPAVWRPPPPRAYLDPAWAQVLLRNLGHWGGGARGVIRTALHLG